MRSNRGPTAKFKKNVIAGNKFERCWSRKQSDVVNWRELNTSGTATWPRQIQRAHAADVVFEQSYGGSTMQIKLASLGLVITFAAAAVAAGQPELARRERRAFCFLRALRGG